MDQSGGREASHVRGTIISKSVFIITSWVSRPPRSVVWWADLSLGTGGRGGRPQLDPLKGKHPYVNRKWMALCVSPAPLLPVLPDAAHFHPENEGLSQNAAAVERPFPP